MIFSKLNHALFSTIFRKGHELHRLLQLKTSTHGINISETCQIVICLDLAASIIGVPFEKVTVLTVVYTNISTPSITTAN